MMKQCKGCGQDKPIEEYAWKNKVKGVRQHRCPPCMRKYSRKHYEENKAAYLARASERNKREYYEKKEIVKRLKSQPCMDCGREYPWYCMEFDHRNPSEKRAAVSTLVLESTGMPRFMAEVAKCDVVCANCHCARTHLRREAGWVDDSTKEAG